MDFFRKRTSDYSDFAYREAVSKLKYLLAESYTPVQKYVPGGTLHRIPHYGSYERLSTIDKPNISIQTSRYPLAPKRPASTDTPDLLSYMRKQEDYIDRLEKDSCSYKDELSKLLSNVRDVISENEKLRDERKTICGSVVDTEEESELEEKIGKKRYCKHITVPNIIFESKISELEAQLTQARIEIRKAQDESNFLKTQRIPEIHHAPLDTNKQIESLQRERDELNQTIHNLQSLVSQLREKEASATQKVKRSLDLVDQAHFDKNQVIDALEMEVRRLKSELERMNDKQRECIQETARRVSEAERRYALQIERLNGDLTSQWDVGNRLNVDLDRARRTETELRRELIQRNATIEDLKKELATKTSNLHSEALTVGAEKETLESELANSKLAIERVERNGRQEVAKLQAEVASLRQRLDRGDSDLLHCRKENLRLSENISTLEKELELAKMAKDSIKDQKRNEDLATMIKDMDSKHAQSVAELEGMIQSQTQLMEKLKTECQSLTQRLEDSTASHKEEMAGLQNNIEYINSKLDAPVNYENQEWRGDGMVDNYQEQGQYEEPKTAGETQKEKESVENYNEQEPVYQEENYNQNPDYSEDPNAYPTDPNAYPDNYAEDQNYAADPNYSEDPNYNAEQNYDTDANYSADPNYVDPNYPNDPNYVEPNYTDDPNYNADPNYPEGYPAEQYQEGDYPAETVQGDALDPSQIAGVDSSGAGIVAQQEPYVPQPTQ